MITKDENEGYDYEQSFLLVKFSLKGILCNNWSSWNTWCISLCFCIYIYALLREKKVIKVIIIILYLKKYFNYLFINVNSSMLQLLFK